jgi:hypothetical protein
MNANLVKMAVGIARIRTVVGKTEGIEELVQREEIRRGTLWRMIESKSVGYPSKGQVNSFRRKKVPLPVVTVPLILEEEEIRIKLVMIRWDLILGSERSEI